MVQDEGVRSLRNVLKGAMRKDILNIKRRPHHQGRLRFQFSLSQFFCFNSSLSWSTPFCNIRYLLSIRRLPTQWYLFAGSFQ